ncbi:capsid protein [Loigolactobacillus backii]|uniref:phage portal protein n=1 Tax=Loigolactobacillus backii TaxID=375175 RepID=UPI000C1CB679|nr:phage portal protein [Loigolactobacillus backii]PIO84394.1 capsid protein [Loigolactobacillus backii]
MGMIKTLSAITDDPRISIDSNEYDRIKRDFKYYSDDYPKRHYLDVKGIKREREFNSINVTKRAAQRIASIVFNEQCEISFKDTNVDQYLEQVLESNDFYNLFEQNLEKGIVAGGFAMRPYVDDDQIKIAWVRANQFYPLRSNTNHISEASIASRTTQTENGQNVYYTLLEFHQWTKYDNKSYYLITNELYRSDQPNIVGNQVNLSRVYPDLQPQVIMAGDAMVQPLFSYFRMPGANNISLESPLGIGIVDNSRHTLNNLNLTHDSFMWEIRNGKRTTIVPAEMIKFDEAHQATWDTDTDAYVAMYGDSFEPKDITNDIRVQQFTDSMNAWLREFEGNVGLSTGTFSYNASNGMQTATEVVSENSTTYQTRSSILTNVTKAINDLCVAILELAGSAQLFSTGTPQFDIGQLDLNDIGLNVHYDDGVFVDKDKQMDEDLKNVVAGTLSKQTFLQRNYGLSDKDAQKELQLIQQETADSQPPMQADEAAFSNQGDE